MVPPHSVNKPLFSLLTVFLCALAFSDARAAVLSGSYVSGGIGGTTAPVPLHADLTATGNVDWALWSDLSTSNVSSVAVSDHKATGTLGISAITPSGTATTVRGSGSTIGTAFTFTDGTTPVSASNATEGLVFASNLNVPTAGEQFSLLGDTTQTLQLDIWAGGFGTPGVAQGKLTLTLGTQTLTLLSQTYTGNVPKDGSLFTVFYQPDSPTDRLTVNYSLNVTTSDGSAHAAIQAISVSTVPEPATGMLLVGAMGVVLGVPRRRG